MALSASLARLSELLESAPLLSDQQPVESPTKSSSPRGKHRHRRERVGDAQRRRRHHKRSHRHHSSHKRSASSRSLHLGEDDTSAPEDGIVTEHDEAGTGGEAKQVASPASPSRSRHSRRRRHRTSAESHFSREVMRDDAEQSPASTSGNGAAPRGATPPPPPPLSSSPAVAAPGDIVTKIPPPHAAVDGSGLDWHDTPWAHDPPESQSPHSAAMADAVELQQVLDNPDWLRGYLLGLGLPEAAVADFIRQAETNVRRLTVETSSASPRSRGKSPRSSTSPPPQSSRRALRRARSSRSVRGTPSPRNTDNGVTPGHATLHSTNMTPTPGRRVASPRHRQGAGGGSPRLATSRSAASPRGLSRTQQSASQVRA